MFGVYLHIPFCRKACTYCNFHFSTNLKGTEEMAKAISGEIDLTAMPPTGMNTLYFGGGTPSLLKPSELELIFAHLRAKTDFSKVQEITLECNPEDISYESLELWHKLGITRLSLGLQSLDDTELKAMNRAHSAALSMWVLEMILNTGVFDVSVDLIYATPWKSNFQWERELDLLLEHPAVGHLSAYALTIEPKTQLNHQIKKGFIQEAPDELMVSQFQMLQEKIKANFWEAYEISNYARPGKRAQHNSQYWKFIPYFGIGPAAHSFDGNKTRYMNVANNALYIQSIQEGILPRTYETLSDIDSLNERLMTGLRTIEGVNVQELHRLYPNWKSLAKNEIESYMLKGHLIEHATGYSLSESGKLISDQIISDLMILE
jgi:oxygen-independent coproporphyrinogen-3 oxidase